MKLTVCKTSKEVADIAANKITNIIANKADALLLLATGDSPTETYHAVSARKEHYSLDCSQIRIHKLDEWVGLGEEEEASCEYYLIHNVLIPWGINKKHYTGPNGLAADMIAECDRNATFLKQSGGVDLCVLGLGMNGHLGLNEPSLNLIAETHLNKLASISKANLKFKRIQSIKNIDQGITAGIAEIMHSKKNLLLVLGKDKRKILSALLSSDITTQLPASLLLLHPDVEILVDEAAYQP